MIYKETAEKNEIKVNEKEIYRYLGYGKEIPDSETLKAIYELLDELINSVNFSACFKIQDISISENIINFESFSAFSKSLSKNLKDCDRCVIFCASIGSGVDRVISKYSRISPSKAVICHAVGTAIIEEWCDLLCERISEKLKDDGLFLRPRFSPGYGDFSIEHQRDILNLLNPAKHIGVSLTDSLMMIPSKSVSGVIGLSKENKNCNKMGCEVCKMRKECDYSRG